MQIDKLTLTNQHTFGANKMGCLKKASKPITNYIDKSIIKTSKKNTAFNQIIKKFINSVKDFFTLKDLFQ